MSSQGEIMTDANTCLLDQKDVDDIIRSFCKHDSFQVKSFVLKPFSDSVTGFLGNHFRLSVIVILNGEESEKTFFVKSAPTEVGSLLYEQTVKTGVFEREIEIYKCVLKDVEDMIQSKINNNDLIWFPRYYFQKHKRLLVLEEIGAKGYKGLTNRETFDVEHTFTALSSIANMHATLFWYEEQITQKTGQKDLSDVLPFLKKEAICTTEDPNNPFTEWCLSMIQSHTNTVDLLDGYNLMQRNEIKKKMVEVMSELLTFVKPSKRFRNILTHADLWCNNILYRYENNKPVHAIFVDFQICRYAPPVQDVLNFIHLVTSKQTRNVCMEDFKQHYYEQLGNYLNLYGLNIENCLPREEFLESCQFYERFSLIVALENLSYTLTPDSVLNEVFSSDEKYREFVFTKREFYVRKCFEDRIYKERVSECLREVINECIFQ